MRSTLASKKAMKKILIITFISLIANINPLFSQWEWQNPKPTGNPINDMYFVDEQNGWMGGDNGTALRTTNGGIGWTVCETSTDKDILEVKFINSVKGLAVCADGSVLKTYDGGNSWLNFPTGQDKVYSLEFYSNYAWLLADSGKILRSSNYGYSWVNEQK
jgi:hypothetical protein